MPSLREKYDLPVNDETLLRLWRLHDELEAIRDHLKRMEDELDDSIEALIAHLPRDERWNVTEECEKLANEAARA